MSKRALVLVSSECTISTFPSDRPRRRRRGMMMSLGGSEYASQRARQQGREVNQLRRYACPEDGEHQRAKPLRGGERAEGKDRKAQAADQRGLESGSGAALVG